MEQFTNDMIKSQLADNLSNVTLLFGYALISNDKDYLLYCNSLLETVLENLTNESLEADEEE